MATTIIMAGSYSNRLDHGGTEFRGLGVIMVSMACRYYTSCLDMGAGCTGRSRLV
jgi:hypothetical protein